MREKDVRTYGMKHKRGTGKIGGALSIRTATDCGIVMRDRWKLDRQREQLARLNRYRKNLPPTDLRPRLRKKVAESQGLEP